MRRIILYMFLAVVFGLTLSARAANIVWVSENLDLDADGIVDDWKWVDILRGAGYSVFSNPGAWMELDANEVDILNKADLVIVSRGTNSGNYNTDAQEVAQWNSITAPMILMNAYITRNIRWLWINSGTMNERVPSPNLEALDLTHPIFAGAPLDKKNQMQVFDPNVKTGDVTFMASTEVGNGTLIAKAAGLDNAFIVEWEKGVESYDGSGQFFGGQRLLFTAGVYPSTGSFGGEYNLIDEGLKLYLNAVNYMLTLRERVNAYKPKPADGSQWKQFTLRTVTMTMPIYIGLAVTSHDTALTAEGRFSNVSFPNNATLTAKTWADADIGLISNDAEPMYVALTSGSKTVFVYHDDPNVVNVETWTEWPIPLQRFTDQGINISNVKSFGIGFGDRNNLQSGGQGKMYIDDIRLYLPR